VYHVFVTRNITQEAIALLSTIAEVDVWQGNLPPSYDELLEHTSQSDGLVCMLSDKVDKHLIQSSPKLKVIAQMAVGYDNIDIAAARKANIVVGHTPGVLTETTADLAWALLMAVSRRVVESDKEVRAGIWRPWGPFVLCGQDIHHATIGIVGMGRIGQAVARRAAGFDMEILYSSLQTVDEVETQFDAKFVPLDYLLQNSDFVSLHTYLDDSSRRLIGRQQFSLMKPSSYLINTARGAIVDSDALTLALQTQQIAGAGLDVFDPEPIPPNHPILKLMNVVVTPHIASASNATRSRMAMMCAENILAGLSEKPLPFAVPLD